MKKFLLILMTMLVCSMSFAVQDESEDIEIKTEETTSNPADDPVRPREPAFIPLYATYHSSLSAVLVTFRRNIGEVQIEIQNLSNGDSSSLEVNSAVGTCMVPCPYAPGYYRITFTIGTGAVYYGEFEI